ncbi:MAG: cytochrome b/b6 domain-containing protein, partial [Coriobacteriales bacterium]
FLPSKVNRHQFGPWMKYYLFIKKKHPISTKYGSPQKLSYFLIPILLICSGLTGFSMWGPTSVWPMFEAITDFLGGPMGVRIVHYFLMWLFIIFIIIHIYLATVEGTAPVKLMFIHKESPGLVVDPTNGKVIGEDNSPVVGGKLMSKEEIEDLFNASRADEETQETQESS